MLVADRLKSTERNRPKTGSQRVESKQLNNVYVREFMAPVSVAIRAKGEVAEVNLSEAHLKNTVAVAKAHAAESAVRLAEVWRR